MIQVFKLKIKAVLHLILLIACIGICALGYISCDSSNIEEKYLLEELPDKTDTTAILAYFPLDGSVEDKSGNDTPIKFIGDSLIFAPGLNSDCGQGLHLDGDSYLMIPIGYYDTLAIVFWVWSDCMINSGEQAYLIDYGLNAFTLNLDGITGATMVSIRNNDCAGSSNDVGGLVNSYSNYSFVYLESSQGTTKVYFKGYLYGDIETIYRHEYPFGVDINPLNDILYIGRSSLRERSENSFFRGMIDEIHVFKHGLSKQQVDQFASINPGTHE